MVQEREGPAKWRGVGELSGENLSFCLDFFGFFCGNDKKNKVFRDQSQTLAEREACLGNILYKHLLIHSFKVKEIIVRF
jgi:hypothetical protein